jgi:hypothetical protein
VPSRSTHSGMALSDFGDVTAWTIVYPFPCFSEGPPPKSAAWRAANHIIRLDWPLGKRLRAKRGLVSACAYKLKPGLGHVPSYGRESSAFSTDDLAKTLEPCSP